MKSSVEAIVTRAAFRLRLTDSGENLGYLERLVEEGARSLNATDTYLILCDETEIVCNSAKLPDNFEELIAFQLSPSDCCSGCCGQLLSTTTAEHGIHTSCCCLSYYYYSRAAFVNFQTSACTYGWYGNFFGIQNNTFTFPSTVTATSIKTYYKGWNDNGTGIMVPTAEQERALSAYAAFQYALECPRGTYEPYQIQQWNAEWKAQKSELNGKRVVRDANMRKPEINAIMNSIIYHPFHFGFGR